MSGIKNPMVSAISSSAFPISGLSQATKQALKLFVPSPNTCYSNSQTNTHATKDSSVDLMLETGYNQKNMLKGSLTSSIGWDISQPTSGSVSFSGDGVRINSVDNSFAAVQAGWAPGHAVSTLTIGKFYRVSLDILITYGTASCTDTAATVYATFTTSGRYEYIFKATTNSFTLKRASACDVTISNLSIVEVGIGARQLTVGWQPKLRRGIKNWIPNSTAQGVVPYGNVYPTGWIGDAGGGITRTITGVGTEIIDGVSIPYFDVRFFGTTTAQQPTHYDPMGGNFPASIGQQWCFSSLVKLVGGTASPNFGMQLSERNSSGTLISQTRTSLGPGPGELTSIYDRKVASRTLNQSTITQAQIQFRYDPTSIGETIDFTIRIAGPQLENGRTNPTTFIPTTSAPASSGVGQWWLDFDGVQSRMNFSSILYADTNTLNFSVVSAISNTYGSTQTILSSYGTSNQRSNGHYFYPTIRSLYRDNDGVSRGYTHTVPNAPYQPIVSSMRRNSTSYRVSANGLPATVTGTLNNITLTNSSLGHQLDGNFLNGGIYGVAVGDNVSPSDSEMISIEKYLGKLQGINL